MNPRKSEVERAIRELRFLQQKSQSVRDKCVLQWPIKFLESLVPKNV